MSFLQSTAFKRASAIGWYVIIILGSSVPGKEIPTFFQFTPDKLIHVIEYFALGFLLTRWLSESVPQKKLFILVLLIGSLCAMNDELYQNLTPNRSPDFYDWCIDVVGIMISVPFFSWLKGKISWV